MSTETQTPQISDVNLSGSIAKISPAFVKAQATVKPALKDARNPHFGSTYADLASAFAACREALAENGIAVLQAPSADGRRVSVCTMLLHESGEWMRSTLTLTAMKDDPQAIGSAITYARRYGLMSMVGLAAEDDDGNAASAPPQQRQQAQRRDTKPQNFCEEYEQKPAPPASKPAAGPDWMSLISKARSKVEIEGVRVALEAALRKEYAPPRDNPKVKATLAALEAKEAELAALAQGGGAG